MALIQAHFYSKVLNMQRTMNVILPQQKNGVGTASQETGNKWPVLYLLHGGSDDHTTWQRQTSIERYALEHGIAVVLASTDLGFYTDMKYGYRFFEHFSEETAADCGGIFPRPFHQTGKHLCCRSVDGGLWRDQAGALLSRTVRGGGVPFRHARSGDPVRNPRNHLFQ